MVHPSKKIFVLGFFVVLSLCIIFYLRPSIDAHDVERMINQDLPLGSTEAEVLHFLDSRDLEHSELYETTDESYFENDTTLKRLINVCGWERKGFITSWSVCIKFRFDTNDHLIDFKVKNEATGL
jgi:hypothetical protein